MQSLLKQPGYRLHPPDSPEARALLVEQGLGPADLDRALAHLEHAEGTTVRIIVGINEDGVFGTGRAGWRPDLPDACHNPFIPLLWLKVHELLGAVPTGSTARFIQDGTLPGEPHGAATGFGLASESRDPKRCSAPYAAAASRPAGSFQKALTAISCRAGPDHELGTPSQRPHARSARQLARGDDRSGRIGADAVPDLLRSDGVRHAT